MKIICIGDSLTYGYGVSFGRNWVDLLKANTNIRTLNFGTNGDTSGYMLERARRNIIPDYGEPGDIAIIMGGANDTLMYGANPNDVSNIIQLAKLCQSREINVIVGVEPGFRDSEFPFYGSMNVDRLNENYNGFADELIRQCADKGLPYVDLREPLAGARLFSDGVHPTEEGHSIIEQEFRKMLKNSI